jgi:ceramide glucosyltransferase
MFVLIVIFALLLAGSLIYSVLSVIAAMRFLSVPAPPKPETHEPISVLKPLAGLDEGLEDNLRSFFEQEYAEFELIMAVRHESDPCVPLVRQLCAEHPNVPSRLLLVGEPPYAHAKVYSLGHLVENAKHDLIVMADSDIRVTRDFLSRVAAEFADGNIALATCPYRAVAGASIWSKLEAESMNTTFWQGVFTARMLEGVKFAVGPTTVARRKMIDAIGGMEGLKDYLAEDFEMGRRAAEKGFNVILSSYVVEHRIGSETMSQNFTHRIRWGRTSRRSRPAGYFGQIFTYPLPLALLLWAAAPAWWQVLLTTLVIRYASAWMTSQVVLGAPLNWVLLPIEDVLGLAFWFAGFFGNSITWRGRTYKMDREGRAVAS